jgi:valyl-tRNA synthetase
MTQTQRAEETEGRSERYDAVSIEKRWQERWERDGLYRVRDDDTRPKYYFLTMYPCPPRTRRSRTTCTR